MFLAVGHFEFRLLMPVADLIRTPHYVRCGADAIGNATQAVMRPPNQLRVS